MSEAQFDWEEFVELAEELARRRGDPSAERSAVSRAYYAAFHAAADYATGSGARLTFTGDDHALVWDWFLRPGADRSLEWVGGAGRRLRQARRHADYDPRPNRGATADASRWVALARQIVTAVRGAV